MSENKLDTGRNWAKFDAHVITAEEYDEIPEITDEMWDRAIRSNGDAEFQAVAASLRSFRLMLEADVADGLKAVGDDWERQGNAVLRDWLKSRAA